MGTTNKEGAMDRREETKAIKTALKAAGIPAARVIHDRGTAWGWMEVMLESAPGTHGHDVCELSGDCPVCRENWKRRDKATEIIQAVTGRCGDYNGRVNITSRRHEGR